MKTINKLLAGVLLLGSFSAHAATTTLNFACISGTGTTTSCANGAAQLSVQVNEVAGQAAFTFYNNVGAQSSITEIYFDSGLSSLSTSNPSISNGSGVNFSFSATPKNLPGWNTISPNFTVSKTSVFTADSNAPVVDNGINHAGESLTMTYYFNNTYDAVINDLVNGNLRIGMHVIGFSEGTSTISTSFVNTKPVPVPAAAWLLGSGLIGLAGFARRKAV